MHGRFLIKLLVFICFVLLKLSLLTSFGQQHKSTLEKQDSATLDHWFLLVEQHMDEEQYDSAQYWINEIGNRISSLPNSYYRYLISTRQAEVYYYNNLPQIGLIESIRCQAIARGMNDSILLADAHNFYGLFYMAMDSAHQALQHFHHAAQLLKYQQYDSLHRNFSLPYHVQGNLAELHLKFRQYDSSILYARLSEQEASQLNKPRGVAIALHTIGEAKLAKGQFDSAIHFLRIASLTSEASQDLDVSLLCFGSISEAFAGQKRFDSARHYLLKGTDLAKLHPNINRFFTTQFLSKSFRLYEAMGYKQLSGNALEQLVYLQQQSMTVYNRQLESIVTASIQNEIELKDMAVAEAQQNRRLANSRFFTALVAMACIAVLFLLYANRQRSKQNLMDVRNKISRDLHDDIGASLSSLNIYSTVARSAIQQSPEKAAAMMDRITAQTMKLMDDMDDIVWSMPTAEGQSVTLESKLKNYGSELLSPKDIVVNYEIDSKVNTSIQSILARKNIWLICKEALNNIAKYSMATKAMVKCGMHNGRFELYIEDNGCGFEVEEQKRSGNGLRNMQSRCEEIQGRFHLSSEPGGGTRLSMSIPESSLK